MAFAKFSTIWHHYENGEAESYNETCFVEINEMIECLPVIAWNEYINYGGGPYAIAFFY